MYFYDTVDQVTVQVTAYEKLHTVNKLLLNGLRNLTRFINSNNKIFGYSICLIQNIFRKIWLRKIDKVMLDAIQWLVVFQRETVSDSVPVWSVFSSRILPLVDKVKANGFELSKKTIQSIDRLEQFMNSASNKSIPIVMQHGDFDLCNLFRRKEALFVVDFEHTEDESLPFFDLANLIFSSLLSEWKHAGGGSTLQSYSRKTGWEFYLRKWICFYAQESSIDVDLLMLLPQIAAIEQNAKIYPSHRDPYDYPMYGQSNFDALMEWEICSK